MQLFGIQVEPQWVAVGVVAFIVAANAGGYIPWPKWPWQGPHVGV